MSGHGRPEDAVPQVRLDRDRELAALGWFRRFTASPPRLVELRRLYEELGHDVLFDRMLPGELSERCAGCMLALTMFRVIYTRPGALPGRVSEPIPERLTDGRLP